MRRKTEQHHRDGVLALLLLAVLAICVLSVLMTGADSYRRLTERDGASYRQRTVLQYVATRLRSADALHAARVGGFDGASAPEGDTLLLAETIDGRDYLTRIYWYDGAVRELFGAADGDFAPEDGEEILPADALSFTLRGGLLTVTAEEGGAAASLCLKVRSGEVAS